MIRAAPKREPDDRQTRIEQTIEPVDSWPARWRVTSRRSYWHHDEIIQGEGFRTSGSFMERYALTRRGASRIAKRMYREQQRRIRFGEYHARNVATMSLKPFARYDSTQEAP